MDKYKRMYFDLLAKEHGGIFGAIGELIAIAYLWKYYRFDQRIYLLGSWVGYTTGSGLFPTWRLTIDELEKLKKYGMEKKQLNFLKDIIDRKFSRVPDLFVVIKRRIEKEKIERTFFVEVKSTISRADRIDLKKEMKELVIKAKEKGFGFVLLTVQFLDNWKFRIYPRVL